MLRHIKFRSYQTGLSKPGKVDTLKADMSAGQFDFARSFPLPSGYRDEFGTYYIVDGHHRLVAALEIERETGDSWAVHALLECGVWNDQVPPPSGHGPMPSRRWWRRLLERFGF